MTRASTHAAGSVEAGALALQRVLALEGRNALARVELAASELERFEMTPAGVLRVDAIRDAVVELASLLDRIERLSDPQRSPDRSARCDLARVWTSVSRRVGPALAVRGVTLVAEVGAEAETETEAEAEGIAEAIGADVRVALPENVLERVLLLWLRLGVAGLESEQALADSPPLALELVRSGAGDSLLVALVARRGEGSAGDRVGVPLRIDAAGRLELDVVLAPWGSVSGTDPARDPGRVALRLPRDPRGDSRTGIGGPHA